ncbi:hypothetical protein, partial [Aquabacterium soli]|uniref:hypothetical protein n=1 Tax=Aquabacterium soli TaxID=2493092 RepID=UPI001F1D8D32
LIFKEHLLNRLSKPLGISACAFCFAFLFAVISREARLSHAFHHLVKRLATFFFIAAFADVN